MVLDGNSKIKYEDKIDNDLQQFLNNYKEQYTPKKSLIFYSIDLINKIPKLKYVLLGQDPYPKKDLHSKNKNEGIANGLAFSTKFGRPIQGSLRNIYKTLTHNDLIEEMPKDGDITSWEERGILLFNTALSTEIEKPKSHTNIWHNFTKKMICEIKNRFPNVQFILLGKDSQKMADICAIPSKRRIEYTHPSPMNLHFDFRECDIFNKMTDVDFNTTHQSIYLFTDGSESKNGSGNSGIFMKRDFSIMKILIETKEPENMRTNNQEELTALLNALRYCYKSDIKNFIWVSDSVYCINTISEYYRNWISKGIKNEKKNIDILDTIFDYIEGRINIYPRHIGGHKNLSKIDKDTHEYFIWYGNYLADYYCKNRQKID